MFEDPIVEEVRAIRQQHAEQFNFDLPAIVADIQRQEQTSGAKYVHRLPRKALTWRASTTHKRRETVNRGQ